VSTAEPPDETPEPEVPEAQVTPAAAPAPPPSGTWPAPTPAGAPPPPTPSTAPAAPEAWSAPAPKPKRKLTWLWVLLGALGLIAVLVVVAVVLFVRTLTGPIDATNKVLAQIKAEHYPAAYRLACSKDRDRYTEERYAQVFKDTVTERGRIKGYDVNYSSIHGSTAEVRYDIEFDGGRTLRLEAQAHKENGKWRTCLLRH
jgi:hypothetical protein